MHAWSRSRRALAAPLIVVASILMSLVTVGVVSAHDEPITGTAALTITIGTGLDPAAARLAAGDIVEWVNSDDERHRMRSTSGPARFDSGNLEPGEAFRIRVVAGTYVYSDHRDRDRTAYHGRLVVAATGSGGTSSNNGAAAGGGEVDPPTAAHVTIGDRVFEPADIAVAVGGTVDWVNRDDRPHTVTAGDGSFGSETMDQGATFSETFATAGSFAYLCAIHPEMQGTIRVVAASGAVAPAAPVAPGGEPAAAAPDPAAPDPAADPAAGVPTTEPLPAGAAAATTSAPASAPPVDSATVTDGATSPAAGDVTAAVQGVQTQGLTRRVAEL